jgi:ATP-dependent RNA helicase MSS116
LIQVGLPSDRSQYIHRVGRTARAGKSGKAILLLQDFEEAFVKKLQGLPVKMTEPVGAQVPPPTFSKNHNSFTRSGKRTTSI